MTDNANSGTSNEVAGPWLSPSEALTRFVPGGQAQVRGVGAVAPIRFGFQVGEIGMLVPPGMLSELVDESEIYSLPTTPRWFRGLINLRGSLVPVFDLKQLFEMQGESAVKANLLVLNTGEEAVGILIDGLPVTLDVTKIPERSPPLPPALRKYSQTVYVRDRELWVEFDFEGFFQAAGNRIVA